MPGVDIIEQFSLGTNLPLDIRYVVDSYYDVSAYWYAGMQVFQTSDSQPYWYDGSIWIPIVDSSSFATFEYVDGSLAARDIEIAQLDASVVRIDASLWNQPVPTDFYSQSYVDASLNLRALKTSVAIYVDQLENVYATGHSRGGFLTIKYTQ